MQRNGDLPESKYPRLRALAIVAVVLAAGVALGALAFVYQDVVTDDSPKAAFDFSYDAESEQLTVVFASGETLDGERVTFRTTDGQRLGDWAGEDAVSAGKQRTVGGVGPDDAVQVVYHHPSDDRTTILAEWRRG